MDALSHLLMARHRNLERRRIADVAGFVGQEQLIRGHPAPPVRAEFVVGRRRSVARHPEQLGEADVVLPQRLTLIRGHPADEQLVEELRRVGDHRHRPQHQFRVAGRVRRPGRGRSGVLAQRSRYAPVEAPHIAQNLVGLLARTEEHLLER